jgi:RNA recognition motif-containing protein
MLLLTGLSPGTSEASIRQLFSHFGQLINCQLCINPATGISAQAAYVTYASIDQAHKVMSMAVSNQIQLDGRVLSARPAAQAATQPSYAQPQPPMQQQHHPQGYMQQQPHMGFQHR